ncbi:MAG: RNA polymerase sigma factor [Planctomycetota bacterium]
MEKESSETALVRLAIKGDREAYASVYASSWGSLFSFVASQVSDADEARSITQAAFVDGWRGIRNLREPERFAGWIRTIAARQVLRWRTRGSGRKDAPKTVAPRPGAEQDSPFDAPDPGASDPAATAERAELEGAVLKALETFPPLHREAVLLRLLEGLKFREIAERLGMTLGQVQGIYCRGVRGLSDMLRRFMPEESR